MHLMDHNGIKDSIRYVLSKTESNENVRKSMKMKCFKTASEIIFTVTYYLTQCISPTSTEFYILICVTGDSQLPTCVLFLEYWHRP